MIPRLHGLLHTQEDTTLKPKGFFLLKTKSLTLKLRNLTLAPRWKQLFDFAKSFDVSR